MKKEEITNRFNRAGKSLNQAGMLFLTIPVMPIILWGILKNNLNSDEINMVLIVSSVIYLSLFVAIALKLISAGGSLFEIPFGQQINTHQVLTNENQELKIITLDNKMVNAEVFINEQPAPDGEYFYANKKIVVENGKITEGKTIKTHQVLTNENQELKIITLDNKMVNAEVFINEQPAPDGEYFYANKKIVVENGKITEGKTIKESD